MQTTSSSPQHADSTPRTRALVLGGGGSAGNAWLIGVIAGLFEAGLDVTQADLIIGTSAGSTAAAQIMGTTPTAPYRAILEAPAPQPRAAPSASERGAPTRAATDHLQRTQAIIDSAADAADMRRRMGAAFLDTDAASDSSVQAQWRATVVARLPKQQWPDQRLLVTAVDAHTGEPVVFDCDCGVDLVDAITASCSGGFAYRIGDRQYIDGGYRRNENADLAVGYERVLVLSPLGGRTRHPLEWGMQLAAQVEELRAGGSNVETILPDRASINAIGTNLMDPSTRVPAAQTGYEQGRVRAAQMSEFWR